MNPEMESPEVDPAEAEQPTDSRPLESMSIDPAENGVVVTHHPKVPERTKAMDYQSVKPKKHVFTSHEEAAKHVAANIHRLKQ
jgi:hypothetical protein